MVPDVFMGNPGQFSYREGLQQQPESPRDVGPEQAAVKPLVEELTDEFLTAREHVAGEKPMQEISRNFFPRSEYVSRVEKIESQFRGEGVLVHAADLEQLDTLLDTLDDEGQINNLSSSLIVEGGNNSLYGARNVALLIDGDGVTLEHISKADSSSSGQGVDFHASDHARVESLKELSEYSRSGDAASINEVNISFKSPEEILGILGKDSVASRLDSAVMLLKTEHRLPLYILKETPKNKDAIRTSITVNRWEPSKSELAELIDKYPVKSAREKYTKMLKSFN